MKAKRSRVKTFIEYNSSFVTIVLYSLAIAVAGVISYFAGKYLLGDMYNGCIRECVYIISGFCAIVISILAFAFVVLGIGIILIYVLTFIFKQKAIMNYTKLPLTLEECELLHIGSFMQYLDYLYKRVTYVDLTVDWTTKNVKQIGFKKADFSKIEDVLTKLLKAEKDNATRMLYTKAFSRFSKTYHHSRLYSGTELFTMIDTKKCSDVFVTAFIPNSEMLQYAIDKHLRH